METIQAKSTRISNGVTWYLEGWKLFAAAPLMWIFLIVMFLVIAVVLSFIPIVGSITLNIIAPALGAGLFYSADQLDRGRGLDASMLLEGLTDSKKRKPLLILGAIALAVGLLSWAMILLTFDTFTREAFEFEAQSMPDLDMSTENILGLLIVLGLNMFLLMGMFYALPLVMLRNAKPMEALQSSFDACLKNVIPLLLFGVVYFLLAIIAIIPFMLGFIVLIPLTFCATYCSYRSVYD